MIQVFRSLPSHPSIWAEIASLPPCLAPGCLGVLLLRYGQALWRLCWHQLLKFDILATIAIVYDVLEPCGLSVKILNYFCFTSSPSTFVFPDQDTETV